MIALRTHYDGPDEAKKHLSLARAKLDKLFYQNEATLSFEKFVTSLNEIYNIYKRRFALIRNIRISKRIILIKSRGPKLVL